MHDRERRRELRGAVFTANGEVLVSLLQSSPWPAHVIQLIGDGLLAALAQDVAGARDLALDCVRELGERDWEGDSELATALIARLGAGPAPLLRPLPIDLDQLADVLEGDPVYGGGRIDLHTGEVWPQPVFEYEMETGEKDEDEEDDERWLWVSSEGSRAGYRDMERFAAGVEDPEIAARLGGALDGRGPSAGSGTSWRIGLPSRTSGLPIRPNAVEDAHEPGWPRRATRPPQRLASVGREPDLTADCRSARYLRQMSAFFKVVSAEGLHV